VDTERAAGIKPPSGTVTFLFTDIEGSTRLWEDVPEAMNAALQLHDSILRAAIEGQGGYVFKTVGDAFCAAFPAAEDAITAAVRAELEIEAQTWTLPRPLRVRIGIHTGRAEERDNDYFGPTVNRTARLEAVGYGGQVLVSGVCAELARDRLPGGVGLIDLGEHRLKDLGRPERVYQVGHASLAERFGPLKSLDSQPNNLPFLPTALVGRESETREIQTLLLRDGVQLLTLAGPGGIGKTRLALQVGADVLDSFAHGVYFVDLSAVCAPDAIVPCMAETLGVRESGRGTLEGALHGHLAGKQILLILDNFEQLVGGAPMVADLLARCSELRVLVTSRELLRLRGEHVYDVPPLDVPAETARGVVDPWEVARCESVTLFTECARRHQPQWSLTMENAQAVASICRRLDGLPLAIELAAARLRLFSPQTLVKRLEERFKVLTGGHRDLPDRQRTLRTAVDWSYELLTGAERELLASLSVFAGGFTAPAAEEVLALAGGDGADAVDLLGSLADKSLLRRLADGGGDPRFSFLETIRDYAREKLAGTPREAPVRDAHAAAFLALAREAEQGLYGSARGSWIRRLDLEIDNVRAALSYLESRGDAERQLDLAARMARYFRTKGMYTEGRRWLAAALPDSCPVSVSVRARALRGAGTLAQFQGDYRVATGILRRAVTLFRQTDDVTGTAYALRDLGWALYRARELDESQEAFRGSRSLGETAGDAYLVALARLGHGALCRERGETDQALEHFVASLAEFRKHGDRESEASALGSIGLSHFMRNDLEEARRHYLEAMRIEIEVGDLPGLAVAYNNLGDIHVRLRAYDEASGFYDKLAQLAEETATSSYLAAAYAGTAECALATSSYTEALTYAKLACRAAEEQGNVFFRALSLRVLGETHLACDDYEHAKECLAEAVALFETIPSDREELERARRCYAATEAAAAGAVPEDARAATLPDGDAAAPNEAERM
jgi:predicted ATPase/class 3 adenylate cyclase